MNLYSYVERAMNILSREKTTDCTFDSTIPTTELEDFLQELFQRDLIYWKNLDERELTEILLVLENILSAKENKHRALVILNDFDNIVSVIYINRVYKKKPDYEPNSLLRFNIMKLKINEKIFFCTPDYYEKIPINVAKTLIELGKLLCVSEINL